MSDAQDVIDRVRIVLNDDVQVSVVDPADTQYRYSDAKLMKYLTLAQREVLKYKPEAGARSVEVTFTTTNPRQRLDPASYYRLLRVEANLDTGDAPDSVGSAIRSVERDLLDTFYGAWTTGTFTGANGSRYKAAALDAADPLAFWVFPPPVVSEGVLVTAVPIPPDITATTDALWLADSYIPALVDYVCHVALRSEDRGESDVNAATYLTSFLAYLGVVRRTVREVSVDQPRPPEGKE